MLTIDPIKLAPTWLQNLVRAARLASDPKAVAFIRMYDNPEGRNPILRDRTSEVRKMLAGLADGRPEDCVEIEGTGADFANYGSDGFTPVGAAYVYNYKLIVI